MRADQICRTAKDGLPRCSGGVGPLSALEAIAGAGDRIRYGRRIIFLERGDLFSCSRKVTAC